LIIDIMDVNQLLEKTKNAIRLREGGKLDLSRKLFSEIVTEAEVLSKSHDKKELDAYIYIMSEWVIQLRHEGKRYYLKALEKARNVYNFSKLNKINNPRAVRGISNTLMNLEAYEVAEDYLEEMLNLIPETDSARRGDIMTHLARCYFRTGQISLAEKELGKAIGNIDKNIGGSSALEIAVWKSHALIVKTLLLNSKGKFKEALKESQNAFKIAEKENAILRMKEATEIINFLKSKIDSNG